MRKFVLGGVFVILSSFFFLGKAYAAVDFRLEDNKEEGKISVIVDSNGSYVGGIDMTIVYSNDIEIGEVEKSTEFCSFGNNINVYSGKITVECFNDLDTEMSGVLATIPYTTDSQEYFFYIDDEHLDVGNLSVGSIEDINRPEKDTEETDGTGEEVEDRTDEKVLDLVIDFLRENALYILAGVILLIASIIGIVGLLPKRN